MTPESPGGEGRLKPCPFCGGTRAHVTTDFGFRAGCPDCHAQAGGSSSRTAAVSGWNRRPPSGDGVGLDAALRKLHDVAERECRDGLGFTEAMAGALVDARRALAALPASPAVRPPSVPAGTALRPAGCWLALDDACEWVERHQATGLMECAAALVELVRDCVDRAVTGDRLSRAATPVPADPTTKDKPPVVLNPECGRDCDDDYVRVGCPVHCPIEPAPETKP